MADLEDVTLDGRPLQSLRVADLKAALEERGLSKSGQKNALIKRLKGALMLENLQKTSTAHVGLQPNSQIGEEMSQNSFIKQYLAKQQELLRQRLEREAREAYETNDQEDHADVNNSVCPQVPNASTAVTDHFKPPGPSSGQAMPAGLSYRHQEANVSRPLASISVAQGRNEAVADSDEEESEDGEDDGDGDGDDDDDWDSNIQRRLPRQPVRAPMARERSAASCQPQQQHIPSVLSPQLRQPTPPPSPPPELSFPLPDTPKQSPPSPDVAEGGRSPSSSSSGSSSSGSRSSSPEPHSGHAERKPGPLTLLARKMESEGAFSGGEWHSRDATRQDISSSSTFTNKVRPEGLMSSVPHMLNAGHAPSNLGTNQGHAQVPELQSTAERDAELEKEKSLELQRQAQKKKQEEERVRAALEREQQKALEKEQFERQQALERERLERELALAREREEKEQALALERQKALEREKGELERRQKEEQEKALALERARILERERALEQERLERERALEAEKIERERLEREKALELERLEKERLEKERQEKEAALERERLEREKALEQERIERERLEQLRALERDRIEREKALEQERIEQERLQREKALEQERIEREKALEQERIERERALEQERIEREKALEQERIEREKALEQERIEREKALERERIEREKAVERERIEREKALEQERIEREKAEQERIEREKVQEQERIERERAAEQERIEKEKAAEKVRIEKERALEQERIEREKALEQERIEKERAAERERIEREKAAEQERIEREKALEEERVEREKALEQERIEKEKALEQKRIEQEKLEREKALELERIEKEKALENERIERERIELEKRLERERIEKERIEREKIEQERALEVERREREQALEQQRLELKKQEDERIERERALKQERIEREKAKEQEKAEREAALEREQLEKVEHERLDLEKEQELRRQVLEEVRKAKPDTLGLEKQRLAELDRVEKKQPTEKENSAHERANESRMADVKSEDHLSPSRGCEIGFVPLPTPPPLSTGTSRKSSTEADKQEGEVQGPVTCERQAEESSTAKSTQPAFRKFRFTRESPLQLQTSSRVIKRPRTFSDSPQPGASVMTANNADGQRQKEQSADLGDVVGHLKPDRNQIDAVDIAKKENATNSMSKDNDELSKNEVAVQESILTAVDDEVVCPSSTVGVPGRGRNIKKTEKNNLRRSSSNDSSSSDSDSASSSSPSNDSSSSSQDKTYTSRLSRDEHNASVQRTPSPAKLEISSANTQINEVLLPKLNEASTQDDLQTTKSSEDDEEKPENSCDGESAVSEPEKGTEDNNETPKAFSSRKISLSSSKSSPGSTENDHDLGTAGGRKRRWGSSTAVTAKKPSISITTESLKSLIPDIKPALNQEAVMELHPEEPVHSETEEEEKDNADQELQIRRTVTQIVHVENQEDGLKEAKRRREESEEEDMVDDKETKTPDEDPTHTGAVEMPSPLHTLHETDVNSVSQSDILIRRSISTQKTGVSITIDDPVRTARQPSPARGNVSNIVHVCNLVRPFTLGQLKELLSRTGTLVEDGFWIDKIKSHCYVTYSSSEEAIATRAALHGVKWPQSNPKLLSVDFCQQDELDFHKGLGPGDRAGIGVHSHGRGLPSLLPERDQWVEREREMERRERARTEREWDRDKIREFGKASEQREAGARRSRSRERRRKDREKSNEKKTEKKEKPEDPPAKLLDDLFRKTKAVPCIYWLPLTEEQYLQREAARIERRKEREMLRKKEEEEAELKKKEENKERMKPGGGLVIDRSESEKIRDRDRARERGRERDREREADKRRDGYRRPGVGTAPSGRHSRSRSDPRERRR